MTRQAMFVHTGIAALLVFFGLLNVTQAGAIATAFYQQLTTADSQVAAQIDTGTLKVLVYAACGFIVALGIGYGVTAQALQSRRSWARPVGFSVGGVFLALTLVGVLGGSVSLVTLALLAMAAFGIVLLRRPEVKAYLSQPKIDNHSDNQPGNQSGNTGDRW
jgi:hypothetical protein